MLIEFVSASQEYQICDLNFDLLTDIYMLKLLMKNIMGLSYIMNLHFSFQMETWRSEFQRVEEQGDEEGFEEL